MLKQPNHSGNILNSRATPTQLAKTFTERPLFIAGLVVVGTFILYLGTLIPEVGWGDSAELALSAYRLGVTHPPGYPLHTLLGKLVSLFFADPAIGTNLLSALCTSLTAGVMSLLIHELSAVPIAAILAPVLFSVLPNIWEMAVVTEVYNVNILFLGCSFYLFLRAEQRQFTKFFLPSAIFFGLSLGTYPANLLLLPVFLLILVIGSPRNKVVMRLFEFCFIAGVFWLIFLLYSVLRLHANLTIRDIFIYAKGARPQSPNDIAFYVDRTIKHISLFSKNFLYLPIPIGLLGAYALYNRRRTAAIFLSIVFGINFLFFSYLAVTDYYTMPTPSYYVFSIWVGYGLAVLFQKSTNRNGALKYISVVLCLLVIGVQLINQLPARFERSNTRPVTELILPALNAFPEDAIVISRWERYAPLLYFQQVRKIRADVTLVVSNEFLNQIDFYSLQFPNRPVLIDNHDKILRENYQIKRYHRLWFLIIVPIEK